MTLHVGGARTKKTTDVPFSRIFLSTQSPVFEALLFGGIAESRGNAPVRVEYALPVVRQMLAYVASAEHAFELDTCMELHKCAATRSRAFSRRRRST